MNFYTSVSRFGNNLLYRGYDNGKKVQKKIKYQPTYFVNTPKSSNWIALDGTKVAPIKFDSMREAKEWLQTNQQVVGRYHCQRYSGTPLCWDAESCSSKSGVDRLRMLGERRMLCEYGHVGSSENLPLLSVAKSVVAFQMSSSYGAT